jgi:SAM-dependent methyltransferase
MRQSVGHGGSFHDVALVTMGRMNMAGLRPEHDVLDIGCGVGRTARYLCDYLSSGARYEGFDVRRGPVTWCQQNISTRCPNFHFTYTPLYNTLYSADTALSSAAEFVFPYPDETFDFALAHSLFTHLPPDVSDNYLHETYRVLRPRGISYSTWLLYSDGNSTNYSNPATSSMHLQSSGVHAVQNPDTPDAAVGYSETWVRDSYVSAGLQIVEPIHPGFDRLQDVIVAVK